MRRGLHFLAIQQNVVLEWQSPRPCGYAKAKLGMLQFNTCICWRGHYAGPNKLLVGDRNDVIRRGMSERARETEEAPQFLMVPLSQQDPLPQAMGNILSRTCTSSWASSVKVAGSAVRGLSNYYERDDTNIQLRSSTQL